MSVRYTFLTRLNNNRIIIVTLLSITKINNNNITLFSVDFSIQKTF